MHDAFRARYFRSLGLVSLLDQHRRLTYASWTAVYGTVRTVVWEEGRRKAPSYPITQGRP